MQNIVLQEIEVLPSIAQQRPKNTWQTGHGEHHVGELCLPSVFLPEHGKDFAVCILYVLSKNK
jgi:hypothetical protein